MDILLLHWPSDDETLFPALRTLEKLRDDYAWAEKNPLKPDMECVEWNRELKQAYIRTGWEKDAIGIMTACRTPIKNNHAHMDPGGFDFCAYGEPLISDPGIFTYKDDINRYHFKSTGWHNTAMINGIPSFCAAAARLNEGLAEGAEEIHIIPATYQTERSLAFPGTKVLMKAGRQMEKVKELLKGADLTVSMVENCCMEGERVCRSLEEIGETPGYYSLIIAKEAARDEE